MNFSTSNVLHTLQTTRELSYKFQSLCEQCLNVGVLTLNRLSCKTFLMATNSLVSISFAWKTTPKLPFPITRVSVYETSCTRSDPWPGVATTVVTFVPSLPEF